MAEVDSSSSPPDNLCVFINTNLDTHFVMLLSDDDTAADLKAMEPSHIRHNIWMSMLPTWHVLIGKIKTEHALCFPEIGEVSVDAMKVRYRSSFYHLSDSMPVKIAFTWVKGDWFLYLDLVPATPIVKIQIGTAGVKMSGSVGQTEKHDLLQTTGYDASVLPVSGDDINQDVALNGLPTEKSLIKINILKVFENKSLSDTLLEKSFAGQVSSLSSIGGPQIHKDVASFQNEFVSGSENFEEASGAGHDKVKISDKAMTDADLRNKKNATNSGTASDIGIKNPQKRSKKRRENELHNTWSNTQETDHSSRDQAHSENQHKMSSIHEHPGKESKKEAIGHSAVMESASLSSPTEGKQKPKQKITQKAQPYFQYSKRQSNMRVTVNSLEDKVIEEFSRAISDNHLEHPGNIPKQAAIDNSTASQCVFLSDQTDKKQKCRQKKTGKIKLPSGQPIVAESVYSLLDKGNEKSSKDSKNEESGSQPGHPGKELEVAAVSLNPCDKKSKHSRNKLRKTELPGNDAVMRKARGKLNGSSSGMGEKSNLETMLGEVAGLLVNFHNASA